MDDILDALLDDTGEPEPLGTNFAGHGPTPQQQAVKTLPERQVIHYDIVRDRRETLRRGYVRGLVDVRMGLACGHNITLRLKDRSAKTGGTVEDQAGKIDSMRCPVCGPRW